jgi:hypothetical protein
MPVLFEIKNYKFFPEANYGSAIVSGINAVKQQDS